VVIRAKDTESMSKTYAATRDFLKQHTPIVELQGTADALVTVCPELQGRVMTSSFAGASGSSLGWVNYDFIAAGKHDPTFNNYGGEDRFWLGPEGGQYGLWFQLEIKQIVQNWFTPEDLNTGAFRVVAHDAQHCRLARRVRVTNASEASFDLEVQRDVNLLGIERFADFFGKAAADELRQARSGAGKALPFVGFETVNVATSNGPTTWEMKSGLVSIWSLGQFPAGERTVVIVPFKSGDDSELGPAAQTNYFGKVPPERLKFAGSALVFRADGQFRAKLGIPRRRARPLAGAVDLKTGTLTLVHFTMPDRPEDHLYVNNTWSLLQTEPYDGDVFNSYNDGPAQPGAKAMGGFFELESLSPTRPLAKGEQLTHTQRTFHIQADPATLDRLLQATLGIELAEVKKFVDGK